MTEAPTPPRRVLPGSLRLFQFRGISVFLHWSWAVVALIELRTRTNSYSIAGWNVAEYLALFAIVLLHEFGHALACRSVGGRADTIMLWPLGGVAFVDPPMRPGAYFWSIAAGPLVNVALVAPLFAALFFVGASRPAVPDLRHFLFALTVINIGLLVFNLLPIYPLDGGQLLMALLWRFTSFERALSIAAHFGLLATGAAVGFAIYKSDVWLGVMAFFAASRCQQGIRVARAIREQRRARAAMLAELGTPPADR
ncbi:MAG: M50 family metallopeptidase [Phycisphaerae bacterium]